MSRTGTAGNLVRGAFCGGVFAAVFLSGAEGGEPFEVLAASAFLFAFGFLCHPVLSHLYLGRPTARPSR